MLGLFGTIWRPLWQKRGEPVELKWLSARTYTAKWYPQGIDVGTWQGRRVVAVSWFRKDKSGRHLASRVSMIDLKRSRLVDIALTFEDDDGRIHPAQIHAGGIAWFGDRLFVAATGQGIWEFDMRAVRRLGRADARRAIGANGRGYGASALAVVRTRVHPVPLRCSFVGRVFDADGTSLPRVLIGEYRNDEKGRIGEFTIPTGDEGFTKLDTSRPGIRHMQGAVHWGEHRYVSQSRDLKAGALWSGTGETLERNEVVLPVGCEDLALDPEDRMLWSLGEHPWRRVVRGIPFTQLDI
ncbi:hypothetical protein [Microbacterium sp. CH12i]|uniref:hypothetical protein n=1 Tax=Microbacterium sp. CH12i TaxID=1479651 RepID=UPI001267B6F9|nr:hypothetical protein [Microbacterium sp. CH12i]